MIKKKISIFGSTGSIGKSLINILKKDKKNFEVVLLTADKNYKDLIKQAKLFNVKNLIIKNEKSYNILKNSPLSKKVNIYKDFTKIKKIFKKKNDFIMSAISGLSGLEPTLISIKHTKNMLIANKESIICGWNLIEKELKKNKTNFIPIDSEHFSIFSLLENNRTDSIDKVYITASGGPFIDFPKKKFKKISPKEALKHPSWQMGKKISIDSATLMNKVFEVIEAKKIFNLDYKNISILTHPNSYVHSIIKFNNGLTKVLIHDPDMTIPIFNSIYCTNKKNINSKPLDIKILNNLNLKKVDINKFPLVNLIKILPKNNSLFEPIITFFSIIVL
ncbi:1-deoxy-D-xylulose-5-phosphate reductoisomerase [Pelagibacterales bacterium SAG-MED01]|nr:1-deoxy-D-xylulose-5-phosphate reductoisomerase [Pelagibacterales bacterium SAG-MED01]